MTTSDLARPLDAVATQRPVGAGLTSDRRRSIGADAHALVELDGAVDGVVQRVKRRQPKNPEEA